MILDWLDSLAGRIVAYTAAVGALGWLIKKGWGMFRKIDKISRAVDWIESEMRPNGGGSLRDAIDEVRADLKEHKKMHANQDAARR